MSGIPLSLSATRWRSRLLEPTCSLYLSSIPVLSYLEEAVMHLDHSDPITRDHMGSVMAQVRQKLFQFLQAEPHNSLGKVARRLSLMLHGLVTPSLP